MYYKKNKRGIEIEEIFLDAKNIPGYHKENMEGAIENPVKNKIFLYIGIYFSVIAFIFLSRLVYLQIISGAALRERSQQNYLKISVIEPERGIIYDRNGEPLLSNALAGNLQTGARKRVYLPEG